MCPSSFPCMIRLPGCSIITLFLCYHQKQPERFSKCLESHQSTGLKRSKQHEKIEHQKLYKTNTSLYCEGVSKARNEQYLYFWVTSSKVEIARISVTFNSLEIPSISNSRATKGQHLILSGSLNLFSRSLRKPILQSWVFKLRQDFCLFLTCKIEEPEKENQEVRREQFNRQSPCGHAQRNPSLCL